MEIFTFIVFIIAASVANLDEDVHAFQPDINQVSFHDEIRND